VTKKHVFHPFPLPYSQVAYFWTLARLFWKPVRLFWTLVRLFWKPVRLFWTLVRLFWKPVRLFWTLVRLCWKPVRLFWTLVRLIWKPVRLFWTHVRLCWKPVRLFPKLVRSLLSPHHHPRPLPRRLPVLEHQLPIHPNRRDAARKGGRVVGGGVVLHGGGVEEHEVGEEAVGHQAPRLDARVLSAQGGHFLDGGFQREQFFLPHVFCQDSWKSAVPPWMARRGAVRADIGMRPGHEIGDVGIEHGLAHDGLRAALGVGVGAIEAVGLGDEPDQRLGGRFVAQAGDFGHGLALVAGVGQVRRQPRLRRVEEFPAGEFGAGEVVVVPVREQHLERRMPEIVGVAVGGDVNALGTGGLHGGHDAPARFPFALHGHLDMRDLHGQFRLPPDVDDFVNGVLDMDVLAADMAHVAPARLASDFGEGQHLVSVGVKRPLVFQPCAEAQRAFFQLGFQAGLHFFHLGSRGVSAETGHAHRIQAQGGMARVGGDVDGNGLALHGGFDSVHGFAAAVLPRDDGRDALAEGGQQRRVFVQGPEMVAVGVNEAGGEHLPFAVVNGFVLEGLEVADFPDAVVLQAHGRTARGRAGAVHQLHILNELRLRQGDFFAFHKLLPCPKPRRRTTARQHDERPFFVKIRPEQVQEADPAARMGCAIAATEADAKAVGMGRAVVQRGGLHHLGVGGCFQQFAAVQRLRPFQQILGGGIDVAIAHDTVEAHEVVELVFAVLPLEAIDPVGGRGLHFQVKNIGVLQPQRAGYFFGEIVGDGFPGQLFDERAEHDVARVAVLPFFAGGKVERRLQFCQELHNRLVVKRIQCPGVADGEVEILRHAAGMVHQLPNRDVGIGEFRQVFLHLIVEAEPPALLQ
jgi:hypothetical protein